LLASLILIAVSVLGGYLLGGLGGKHTWVQALGAGQRNIAAAMVVATMNFSNDEVVMIVVFSLIGLMTVTPLAMELGKRAKVAEVETAVAH
jgi:BASS family bile acid:Na+ symporter